MWAQPCAAVSTQLQNIGSRAKIILVVRGQNCIRSMSWILTSASIVAYQSTHGMPRVDGTDKCTYHIAGRLTILFARINEGLLT